MTASGFDWGGAFDRSQGALAYVPRASVGFDLFNPSSYHEIVDNPGKVISQAAKDVSHPDKLVANAAKQLGPIVDAAKMIASNAIGLVSLIPGLGTGVAGALSAGLAVLEGGSPLDIAIRTAYGALPIPPGIKQFTDLVLDGIIALIDAGGNLGQAAVLAIKNTLLAKVPDFAKGMATSAFDTLAHLVIQGTSGKPTVAVTGKPVPAVHAKAIQAAHAAGKPLPPHITPVPPTAKAHLAIHLALGTKPAVAPPPAIPGPAPKKKDFASIVRSQKPIIERSGVRVA